MTTRVDTKKVACRIGVLLVLICTIGFVYMVTVASSSNDASFSDYPYPVWFPLVKRDISGTIPAPSPTATRSLFPFTFDDSSPIYTANFANNAGCNWLGVAGQVLDLDGESVPARAYMIWVTEGGLSYQTFAGSTPAYGPSGWQVYLNDRPRIETHRIQLFTLSGTPVSDNYEFTTRDSCNENLVLINFVQNH